MTGDSDDTSKQKRQGESGKATRKVVDTVMQTEYKVDPKDGITKLFTTAKQKCENCGTPVKPIFKAGPSPEDWFWHQCDTCDEVFCEECAWTEDDGTVMCSTCYQTKLLQEGK